MAAYKLPAERPRERKRFLTAREVEDMAAADVPEIIHASDLVITDAAREAASDLGIRIVSPEDQRRRANIANAGTLAPAREPDRTTYPVSGSATLGVAATAPQRDTPQGASIASDASPRLADDELVDAVAAAIRARWRPAQRYSRQLLGSNPN